jgi:hypothetical protein
MGRSSCCASARARSSCCSLAMGSSSTHAGPSSSSSATRSLAAAAAGAAWRGPGGSEIAAHREDGLERKPRRGGIRRVPTRPWDITASPPAATAPAWAGAVAIAGVRLWEQETWSSIFRFVLTWCYCTSTKNLQFLSFLRRLV